MRRIKQEEIKDIRRALLSQQKGKCALCQEDCYQPVLDHDHATGKLRGVLCKNCNYVEGFLNNRLNKGNKLITYINNLRQYLLRDLRFNGENLLHPDYETEKELQIRRRIRSTQTLLKAARTEPTRANHRNTIKRLNKLLREERKRLNEAD